ncbi:SufD family Fe-S cluster assembly protein [Candidatus Dojkabacteria bacterium]|uniref:SufD family Fe-S cluster assembly protein n=1 Tax=Candidatus Dojkabacteria bacterium TaxID=2099670 RepID=A0A5C7J6H6_9BACT|nr:MAG: SufD family Fe-S cluster assembly protein [Candidatus Dojkabacteria bacterium]
MKSQCTILEQSNTQEKFCVDKPDTHVFFLINYSGTLHVEIASEAASVYIFGLYFGKGEEQLKIKTIQDHKIGNSVSDLFIRGVFYDSSKFLFEGLINIAKNAQRSNAYQKNQNLLLSKDAFVDSRPFLEIQANDVRCTHGSTTGRVDKELLEYLASRGISKQHGEQLIINGFINDIFERIKVVAPDLHTSQLRKKVVQYHDVFDE